MSNEAEAKPWCGYRTQVDQPGLYREEGIKNASQDPTIPQRLVWASENKVVDWFLLRDTRTYNIHTGHAQVYNLKKEYRNFDFLYHQGDIWAKSRTEKPKE